MSTVRDSWPHVTHASHLIDEIRDSLKIYCPGARLRKHPSVVKKTAELVTNVKIPRYSSWHIVAKKYTRNITDECKFDWLLENN